MKDFITLAKNVRGMKRCKDEVLQVTAIAEGSANRRGHGPANFPTFLVDPQCVVDFTFFFKLCFEVSSFAKFVTFDPVIKIVERLNEGRVDDESVDVLGNLRMSEDGIHLNTAVGMIEEEDPGNEV